MPRKTLLGTSQRRPRMFEGGAPDSTTSYERPSSVRLRSESELEALRARRPCCIGGLDSGRRELPPTVVGAQRPTKQGREATRMSGWYRVRALAMALACIASAHESAEAQVRGMALVHERVALP